MMSSLAPPPSAQTTGLQAPLSPDPRAPEAGVDHARGWEDLYRAHVGPLYRYVYARTGNRGDAEELTSQVFLQAFPRLGWRPTPEMRPYLFATARTVLADHWRRHYGAHLDDLPFDIVDPGAGPDDDGSGVSPSRTAHLLNRLPDR
jgi:DNA-directed RNA polymerase specialized sigma24 family protein